MVVWWYGAGLAVDGKKDLWVSSHGGAVYMVSAAQGTFGKYVGMITGKKGSLDLSAVTLYPD